jgi:hypothetical protein
VEDFMRLGSLVVCVILSVAQGQAAKPARPAVHAKKVTLPQAHVGSQYDVALEIVLSIPYGRAQCAVTGGPAWLSFDASKFEFSGVPNETVSTSYDMKLTVKDIGNPANSETIDLPLVVIHGPVVVYADPKLAPKVPTKADAGEAISPFAGVAAGGNNAGTGGDAGGVGPPVSYSPTLSLTSQVEEGITQITGQVAGIPAGATKPVVEVWIIPWRQQPYRATLTAPDKEGNPGTATQAMLDANKSFKATLTVPLAADERVSVRLMPPVGSGLTLVAAGGVVERHTDLIGEIPYPEVIVPESLTVGMQAITGVVKRLPEPPIRGTAADATHNMPATPGNLPLLGVDINDSQTGRSRAALSGAVTDSIAQATQVGLDGSFTLTLAKPLAGGQTVTLVPIAPAGHRFVRPPDIHDWRASTEGEHRPLEAPVHGPLKVYSPLALNQPVISSKLTDSTTAITGIATATQASGTTVNVAVQRIRPGRGGDDPDCVTMDDLDSSAEGKGPEFELLTGSSGGARTVATGSNGAFSLTLANPLLEGDRVRIVQVLPAGTNLLKEEKKRCRSSAYEVTSVADWGRVHAYFTAGILISNNSSITQTGSTTQDNGNFSQAHQFLSLTVDKSWSLPGCYLRTFAVEDDSPSTQRHDKCYDWRSGRSWDAERRQHLRPGVSSYFEARLTAIPVAQVSTSTTSTSGSASGTSGYTLSANQLTSAQTARLGVGAYLPFLVTRWDYHREPNALFLAPLAKVGFDTVTGASQQTVILSDGTLGKINLENVYNFYAFGARVGHYQMTRSTRRAPELNSYLDIVAGPYSNLDSYVCHRTPATGGNGKPYVGIPGYTPPTNNASQTCTVDYPTYYSGTPPVSTSGAVWAPVDSRKRLYRLDLEGLLKIPNTPLYVGFNANLAQKSLGATHLDHGYAAPDDLRFLFGTRFDIGTALSKLGVNPF